ncbi:diaminopimelate epimerase [Asticcacaulis benevestitus]|uniref:Diaminopimelate epimerase n=1 Tax=Asticcacaulis benevestitus DSM 16100 = ATCC BAA-896 TaxID=1121022 RepID=V4PZE6_9CAUL|nr:diaminopimelate epimerase [Asticcacaulis benevestitus]ESQ93746.1 diaminopimelate epimerase [Asticcacaulis benevestitus DSM 16100 = ATCC BAA-896]
MTRPFLKMNGLGNDFIVVDARDTAFTPAPEQIRAWGDRASGIGFDQLISIEGSPQGDAFMRVWNNDGGTVETCGNALRCVAWYLNRDASDKTLKIDTLGGLAKARVLRADAKTGTASVDMGKPGLDWHQIPLSEEMNTERLELQVGPIDAPLYHTPVAVSMGNPHVVFFVADVNRVDVTATGSLIENHPLFPEGVNVEFAQIIDRQTIRMRVWERGAGITMACGTGACATLVAAARRGLTDRSATVIMDGGPLHIAWAENDHVIMTGPIEVEFEGTL